MPDVESVLRCIGKWKYLIVFDLQSVFYQIPLSNDSLKYCGVATPYRGVRVYTRCAMGMPGSETALEELMCRILGDLLQEGIVCKLADDLYCGGDTPEQLLHNWQRVLTALEKCNMKLAPSKTVICPKTTNILGWVWSEGKLSASPHRISTLVSCQPPETVHGVRSFIGAYKVLSRVMPQCSMYVSPLDDLTAGRASQEKIQWNDEFLEYFNRAKNALKNHSIGASVKHFSPYLIQSSKTACVLTDSQPCVQAIQKLYRGEFSASPRVTSFLSIVSRYQVSVKHLAGSANVPSDFASRNAPECTEEKCQICTFIQVMEDSVVRSIKVDDILNETSRLPFTTRSAWRDIQADCPDLRRVHSHLKQGTRPSKKVTNVKDVKRYLQVATISKDNVLVVKRSIPLLPDKEQIIVPRSVLDGLLTAIHIKLDHPTKHQLEMIVKRYFFGLDMNKTIERVTNSCHICASIKKFPKALVDQSSGDPPDSIGISFAADILKRSRQCIFVLRETVTSYTKAVIIDNEQQGTLREALICSSTDMHPIHGPPAVIRVDPAPAFIALRDDEGLKQANITLDVGRVKNVNKTPVAEKAIAELEDELITLKYL
ncbi:uncharacterized protein LOC128557938 [Mercenaria mercenaria]|uniref:uncharacterized protein LOC128557938 n=1 Tax=Mercenaria mercenaria TaxID=6596 RepID=UPI00234E5B2E|nr:uncharacterized protein LOC128557938 [Mercenaria mercenaria]